ncbi:E1-E2 ATPase-domain-containing protein [Neurospora tetraspora]|uniref:E1-E2 ATPase-domain-containing protein n=1 Tax=Neurospora tetraspora TaxID=94610 RepID=A0AAE0JDC6_9PEZI|nr:E1-E2 ATPase-domain-containing protein [Neurospora tetraspora]
MKPTNGIPTRRRQQQQQQSSSATTGTETSDITASKATITTSFLISNLHCPSCVSTIKDVLLHSEPSSGSHIRWVSPNVVTSVVTVEHYDSGSNSAASVSSLIRDMHRALEDSGFEVSGVTTTATSTVGISDNDNNNNDDNGFLVRRDLGIVAENDGGHDANIPGSSRPQASLPSSSSAFSRWVTTASRLNLGSLPGAAQSQKLAEAHLQNCEQCRTSKATTTGHQVEEKKTSEKEKESVGGPKSSVSEVRRGNAPDFAAARQRNMASTSTTKSLISTDTVVDLGKVPSSQSPPPLYRATVAIGGMTCAACVNAITNELNKKDWIANVSVNLINNSAAIDIHDESRATELVEAIEDLGYDAKLDKVVALVDPQPKPPPKAKARRESSSDTWRATLSIGGMTCASCANSITNEMRKRDWVQDITVNLLTNSATVEFAGGKENANKLVGEIDDLGFEATLNEGTLVNVAIQEEEERSNPEEEQQRREVEIRIQGMYCEHCPSRVSASLVAGFRRQLDVISQPSHKRPIVKVVYVPDAPEFTIRHILRAIEASDPAFKASIYHPPSLEEQSKAIQRHHQLQILWRVIFSFVVAIPTFIIGIVYMTLVPSSSGNTSREFLMKPWTSGISRAQIALFILATPVYLFAADIFHRRAYKEIRTLWRRASRVPLLQRFYRFGSMNTLMSLGTTIAYVSSVCQMIAAGAQKVHMVDDSNFYFDSVVFLTFFLLVGRLIESYSKSRTGDAVEMLGKLRPTTAILVEGYGTEKERDEVVQADSLDYGDVVRIPHGASPPADGIVVRGQGSLDESSLTGESKPVKKAVGDEVYTGTVNKDAPLLVRVTGVAGKSMLDEVVKAVREGQTRRAPIEQVADILTAYFVPVVIAIAVATWIIWLAVGYSGHVSDDFLGDTKGGWVVFALQFAISVCVVACPCGLALAAPTAIFVGGGIAAKHGILAKGGGEAFEKASRVDCVVFDKTGTLTTGGEPKITDSEVFGAAADEENGMVLAALKAVEENSSHPIAKAIVAFCAAKTSAKTQVEDLQEIAGKGMKARCLGVDSQDDFDLMVGNEALMEDFAVTVSDQTVQTLQKWKSEAKSVALVAIRRHQGSDASGWLLAVALAISDPIRPEAPLIVKALQSRGTRVWMLSGDNPVTAAAVAHQLGIPADQVIAGVLPTGKADKIRYLQGTEKARVGKDSESSTRRAMVAMVGDGINDSPALATADIGIAIGSGADIAISSADFVLINSDLRGVVTLLDLSATVFRRIKFNFGWAVVYNCIALPVAAGAFYPIVSDGNHVKLDPVWASLAMALSSISVVLSSLALRSRVFGIGFRARKIGV